MAGFGSTRIGSQLEEPSSVGTGGLHFEDDEPLSFGNTDVSPDTAMSWNTAQTVDALYLGLSAAQNTFIIGEHADRAYDFAHGARTNPTVFLQSAAQSASEFSEWNVGKISFGLGIATVATDYSVGRNADGTNFLQLNVPTGASFELSVNDVAQMTLSATAVDFQDNSITTTGGGSLTGTWSDLGAVTTIDINGGTIDGVTIGGAVAGAGTFTALTATSLDLNGALDLDVAALGATITNTADGASSQVMILEGDRATMADNDEAYLSLRLSNDGGVQTEFARLTWVATDVNAATSVDGRFDIAVVTAGALANELSLTGAALYPFTTGGLTLGSATNPFGALNLSSGGNINFANGDVQWAHAAGQITFTGEFFGNNAASGGFHGDAAASATVPTFSPLRTDTDTGIGSAGADILSLIAGAVEVVRLTEAGVSGNTATLAGGTLTSGGTDDKILDLSATLNDAGAAGGSDIFRLIKGNLTATNTTGWNNVYLMDLQVGGSTRIYYDHLNTRLGLSSSAATQIGIEVDAQGAGNNIAGRPLLLSAGNAGSQTTGAAGGELFLESGDASGSGNNNGGNITLTAGTATGSGQSGVVNINQPGGTPGTDALGLTHNGTDGVLINLDSTGDITFGIGAGNTSFSVSAESVILANDILIRRDVNAGLTASTTQTQGQGALTAEVNEVATVANVNDTVTLPTAVAGLRIVIINNGANTLRIFPASGDNLGAGVDTATTLASGSNVVYQSYNATNWESI